MPAGIVGTRRAPPCSAADSMRITVHGRGAHGSMPQAAVDPVVLAAIIVVRLQTVVAREVAPGDVAVITVGSIRAGAEDNVIPDHAVLQLNVRTYDDRTRAAVLAAIARIVRAECDASRIHPGLKTLSSSTATRSPTTTRRSPVGSPPRSTTSSATVPASLPQQSASEDFSDLPRQLGAPYTYWGIGGTDPELYRAAEAAGRLDQDIPVNHSATFAPVLQPTLDTGTQALVVAALAWLHQS